jgi:hypothetical protein
MDGTLDAGFGTGGINKVCPNGNGMDLIVEPDDTVIVVGACNNKFTTVRLTSSGATDAGFGSAGFLYYGNAGTDATNRGLAYRIHKEAGEYFVVGRNYVSSTDTESAILKYESNWAADTGFGSAGVYSFNPSTGIDSIRAIDIDSTTSDIYIGGGKDETNDTDFSPGQGYVARIDSAAALDTSFTTTGFYYHKVAEYYATYVSAIKLQFPGTANARVLATCVYGGSDPDQVIGLIP